VTIASARLVGAKNRVPARGTGPVSVDGLGDNNDVAAIGRLQALCQPLWFVLLNFGEQRRLLRLTASVRLSWVEAAHSHRGRYDATFMVVAAYYSHNNTAQNLKTKTD
jgi:hypothetical protein